MHSSLYREIILDHWRNPRNFGHLSDAGAHAELENVLCGDRISMNIAVEGGCMRDIRFSGTGCAIAMASASLLTERIKNGNISIHEIVSEASVLDALGVELSPIRRTCALLPLQALQKAIVNLRND